jgi:GntR family histidine utilization transcriptional repressor
MDAINRNAADVAKTAPLYERIKTYLGQRIAAGDFSDGQKLPSEHGLMKIFGASRMTVHRALREMAADGLLRRVQGVGTFLRPAQPRSALLEIFDISDDIAGRGHVHEARVISLQAIAADPDTAAMLLLRHGGQVFYSAIVHCENGVPVQLEERFVAPGFAPDYLAQDFTQKTTSRYLNDIAMPSEVEHIVHAVGADAQAQKFLDIGPNESCLLVERRTWTAAGPATRSLLTHPGSRYSLGSRYDPNRTGKP